ncbi:MAG TPA: class I SAM-dependent methyltransferase [Terriglobales bacterium]
MLKIEPTKRFSSRVENYVRFRPSYPREVIPVLEQECGLARSTVIADIASGTGLFTRLLLEHGNRVFGIEPNPDMRRAGEAFLGGFPNFVSIDGTAEHTTLSDDSVDLITCAQAAHWFDRDKAMPEFQRILKASGYLVLIWNDRRAGNRFSGSYEDLVVKYGTDYSEVQRLGRVIDGSEFFRALPCQKRTLRNYQDLDYSSLEGRLLSSSYAPQYGEPGCEQMLGELRKIFAQHQEDGLVRMEYDTNVYFGRLHL